MSVLSMAVAISVSGVFSLLAIGGHGALQRLRDNLAVEVFFDPALPSQDAAVLAERSIGSLSQVRAYSFTSKEDALTDFAKSSGENVESVLGMNPLPANVTIHLKDPSAKSAREVMAAVRAIPSVSDVRSDLDLLSQLEEKARKLDWIATIVTALLGLSALFFVVTSARMGFMARQDTIHAMTLLGARRARIVGPFILEGALAGLAAGAIGALILVALGKLGVQALGVELSITSAIHYRMLLPTITCFAGLLLGIIGTTLSTYRGGKQIPT